MAGACACLTALFIASWAMRNSSASTSGRRRPVRSSSVTWIGTPETSLRFRAIDPIAVPRLSLAPTLVRRVTTDRRISETTAVIRSRSSSTRSAWSGDMGPAASASTR